MLKGKKSSSLGGAGLREAGVCNSIVQNLKAQSQPAQLSALQAQFREPLTLPCTQVPINLFGTLLAVMSLWCLEGAALQHIAVRLPVNHLPSLCLGFLKWNTG